jgi:hypothetical protein
MTKANGTSYEPVNASPVKSFFVHMLTRDIGLEEAILDLLDNCVDGILRSKGADWFCQSDMAPFDHLIWPHLSY